MLTGRPLHRTTDDLPSGNVGRCGRHRRRSRPHEADEPPGDLELLVFWAEAFELQVEEATHRREGLRSRARRARAAEGAGDTARREGLPRHPSKRVREDTAEGRARGTGRCPPDDTLDESADVSRIRRTQELGREGHLGRLVKRPFELEHVDDVPTVRAPFGVLRFE